MSPGALPLTESTTRPFPACSYTQNVIAETLRMYPAPPLLIRRALEEDEWPQGGTGTTIRVQRASDLFISLYNMGRSGHIWDNPGMSAPMRAHGGTSTKALTPPLAGVPLSRPARHL